LFNKYTGFAFRKALFLGQRPTLVRPLSYGERFFVDKTVPFLSGALEI